MFDRLRSALLAGAFLAAATPALAANGITTTVVPLLPGTLATSLIRAGDGNFWFADFYQISGGTGYLVRLQPDGTTTYFPMPNFSRPGFPAQPTLALAIAIAPVPPAHTGQNPALVFNWIAYNSVTQLANESGLGTVNINHPGSISEYASQMPGDPLYSPNVALEPFAFAIASSSQPGLIWSDAQPIPVSSTSPALVAGILFPFTQLSRPRVLAKATLRSTDCCTLNDLVTGSDGNVWYTGYGSVGRIDRAGSREFSLPCCGPTALAPAGADIFAGAVGGVYSLDYTGSVTGFNAWPLLGFDIFLFAAAPDALWAISWQTSLDALYFMRMDKSGQWSAYEVPSPVGYGVRPELTTLAVAADGTVWTGVGNPYSAPAGSALVSLKSNRVLSTQPSQLSLTSGQSVLVSVTETNYIGTAFTSSVPDGCPLSVTPGPNPGTFVVSATATPRLYPCGVTFADPDGISVWLSASLSNAAGIEPAWHQRMLDVSRRPRILGH